MPASLTVVWKLIKTIKLHEMGARIMMAEFNDQSDKNRVIKDGAMEL